MEDDAGEKGGTKGPLDLKRSPAREYLDQAEPLSIRVRGSNWGLEPISEKDRAGSGKGIWQGLVDFFKRK